MNPEIQKLLLNLNTELQLTSQEIADILWLTSHRLENLGITPPTEIIKPSEESPETEILSPVITPQKPSINKEQATAKIYPKIKPIKREIRSEEEVIPLSIPDAPSLREPLGLLKQLRPLMHRVPSATEEILDEEATVNKIAEERFFLPVMQPVLEPWLELALVVDEQNSMLIWRHTIVELKHLLENYGIFRHVSTLSMVAEAEGKLTLRNNIGINTQERDSITPKELIDPSGSRLILIVSDCVDKIWRNGEVLSFLKEWTQTSPVAILQMLPERMWQRTALSLGSMVLFKALSAGVSNRDLIITKQLLWDDIEFSTAIKIPVFSLETEILSKWAKMIAAKGQTEAVGFIFSPELEDTSDLEETLPDPVQDAQERVNRFYLASSPLGVKLAMLLAAAPVIILPVVRIIQERMLPESSQIQVAEVFLGGLLKPLTAIERFTNPDEVQYDFMSEEIRIILLKNAPKSQAIRVFNKVSEYVAAQLGKSVKKFAAQLQNPYQQQEVKSFAEVSEGILRNLGGEYAQFAEKIELASQDNRQLLGEINQIQILTTYTEEPWSLPLDVLVLSTNNSASIGGGRLTESFLEFIGEDNGKILGKARIDVFRTLHKKCITPDSPLPISLSTSIKDLLNISDTSQPCFLFYATVENPKPTVENAVLATEAIIKLMVQYQLKQVVLPLLGTGNNGLAKEEVAVAMITKIREVCSDLPPQTIESINIIDRDENTLEMMRRIFAEAEFKESSPLSQLTTETVYVDRRGEIIRQETVNVRYYNETLAECLQSLHMIHIPGGEFMMGSPQTEKYRQSSESPQHLVRVKPFFMSQTLITQAQWRAIARLPKEAIELKLEPSNSPGDDLPVESVKWKETLEFCARLSRYTGINYRLPSEAEWEYGCRAGTTTPFHFGETLTGKLANYRASETYQEEVAVEGKRTTTPVRSFKPNSYGLYDMHGNVFEWCLDPWHNNYKGAPEDGSIWDQDNHDNFYQDILNSIQILIKDKRTHVLRGGSWILKPSGCRSAYRGIEEAGLIFLSDVGFRVVCVPQDS